MRPGNPPPSGAQIVLESLYAMLALASVALFGLRQIQSPDSEFVRLADHMDTGVCVLFFTKAMWDLWRAPNRRAWWKWGWADLVASIPDIEALRALRGVRLVFIVRVLRSTTRSVHGVMTLFNVGRARSVAATVFALILISIISSSFLILGVESAHPGANILTADDALLWSVSTLFGAEPAGFGDHYPVTAAGRVIAVWLLIVSLGLIGSLAGLISSWIEEAHH